jgi:hypothetical protein
MISKRAFLGTFAVLIVLIGSVGVVVLKSKNFSPIFRAKENQNEKILAKVGEENLYQKDLEYEMSTHPQKEDPSTRGILIQKLINDSIILQGAKADGLLSLDQTIYNSPNKDYGKRVHVIAQAKTTIDSKTDRIKGSAISIWFRNNHFIGPLGLEKSKQIAFEKISALQKKIKDHTITIEEAGHDIANDESLADIDKAWRNNAIAQFDVPLDKPITISKEFDALIRKLNTGEVSEVFLARNVDTHPNEQYEALYYVAQVTDKVQKGNTLSYADWLAAKTKNYEVVLY